MISLLINIVIMLAIAGLILYVVDQLPLDATIKKLIHIVTVVLCALYLLQLIAGVNIGTVRLG